MRIVQIISNDIKDMFVVSVDPLADNSFHDSAVLDAMILRPVICWALIEVEVKDGVFETSVHPLVVGEGGMLTDVLSDNTVLGLFQVSSHNPEWIIDEALLEKFGQAARDMIQGNQLFFEKTAEEVEVDEL